MGNLARHLLQLYRNQQTDEFTPLCAVIEKLHIDGNNEAKTLATTAILEAIQNVWTHADVDPEEFSKFLQPESKRYWIQLNGFWTKQSSPRH